MIRGRKEYMISYDGLYELIPNDRFITKTELIQERKYIINNLDNTLLI